MQMIKVTLDNDADVKATYNPRLRHMDDGSFLWDLIFYFLIKQLIYQRNILKYLWRLDLHKAYVHYHKSNVSVWGWGGGGCLGWGWGDRRTEIRVSVRRAVANMDAYILPKFNSPRLIQISAKFQHVLVSLKGILIT